MSQHTDFKSFNSFASEIRDLIWEACLPGPRVVCVHQRVLKQPRLSLRIWSNKADDDFWGPEKDHIPYRDDEELERDYLAFSSHIPTPQILLVLLETCRESRNAVTRRYSLTFGSDDYPPTIWFDFKADVLYTKLDYANNKSYDAADFGDAAEQVKNLAIPSYSYSVSGDHGLEKLCYIMSIFCNLDSLSLVHQQHKQYHTGARSGDGPLALMDETHLLVWKQYAGQSVERERHLDVDRVKSCRNNWFMNTGSSAQGPRSADRGDAARYARRKAHCLANNEPAWKIPDIKYRSVTIEAMKNKLESIVGGSDNVYKLCGITNTMVLKVINGEYNPESGLSPIEEIHYARLVQEAWRKSNRWISYDHRDWTWKELMAAPMIDISRERLEKIQREYGSGST